MEIMLCGAADTERVRAEFVDVVSAIGAVPLHYLSGDVLHINSATSTWDSNSRASVLSADLCVFVIVESYGNITWSTELREALNAGKPFLLLCLDRTYQRYLNLTHSIGDPSAITDPSERALVAAMGEMERERNLTLVPFQYGTFRDVLQRQLARLFRQSLALVEQRNRRAGVGVLFVDPARLSLQDLAWAAEVATDDFEDKAVRKRAILALADRGAADSDTVLALMHSQEQGVQRLAFRELSRLHPQRPPDAELLLQAVSIANASDDVGVARRLIPVLFEFGIDPGLAAVGGLNLDEDGTRRRVVEALELHEDEIVAAGLVDVAIQIARRCEGSRPAEASWKERLKALIERWDAPPDD